ncbi:hypothetical protein FOXB_05650 [Fusarium oxysporum f. sp. conglutinans Fo5176]|uniref:Uncharacterized protein n=1 Tax=Fusarium oxysporum (strain Fo5176) TaxID=660025 RepID=F9FGX1_FUSOF|nr:hypothetical protein FOXB_05650 [Fusarium oxysporum f. sp. conglutinans Fo5176]
MSFGRTRGLWVAGGQAHPEIWVWLLPPRTCRILFLVTPASKTLTIITHNQNPNPPEESQKSPTNTLLTHQFRLPRALDPRIPGHSYWTLSSIPQPFHHHNLSTSTDCDLDMDDPGWSWPAWKFGMKRDDLFHTLHEKYNTFTFNLQDPEAFHHDVYEISRDADTVDDFHRLLDERKQQRIHELHESLESLAVEIIANPKLMDSEHWQYALQLFRTKSFDSIVRYFASYLPEQYLDHNDRDHDAISIASLSSFSETNSVKTESTTASSVDDASSFFDDEPILTKGPLSIHTDIRPSSLVHDEDETSQFDDGDFAVASDSDCAESQSSLDVMDDGEQSNDKYEDDLEEEDDFPTTQFPEDASDGCDFYDDTPNFDDTPTPRQESIAPCYIEYKSVAAWRIPSPRRSPSPSPRSHHPYRREGSSLKDIRRSPEESMSKIQKPMHEQRKRPAFRKRLD